MEAYNKIEVLDKLFLDILNKFNPFTQLYIEILKKNVIKILYY